MIVLEELRGNPVLGEGLGAVAFREETTVIAKAGGGDDDDTRERGFIGSKGQNTYLIIRVMVINGAQWRCTTASWGNELIVIRRYGSPSMIAAYQNRFFVESLCPQSVILCSPPQTFTVLLLRIRYRAFTANGVYCRGNILILCLSLKRP